ncbi:unnamed protein product [Cyprideis torosa]|uniref:Uncharacterized protein n=1 Tax=Cyprideis torosa TaxID=163714 RepID=A0A7R8WDS6_9CRUS|nr:unnamed protein product [Cyprideis torosa]CAG0894966.1 unnamed protein product [Cyprideis torosa]
MIFSFVNTIHPSPSEDYGVPDLSQLYPEIEVNIEIILSSNPSFFNHTSSSTRRDSSIPPSPSEDYLVLVCLVPNRVGVLFSANCRNEILFHVQTVSPKRDPSIRSRFLLCDRIQYLMPDSLNYDSCVPSKPKSRKCEFPFGLVPLPLCDRTSSSKRIIVYQFLVNSIPSQKRILNYSSVQAPPFCDHTSSSTSFRDAIPPSPSEDYRVPVPGQLYSEIEVNIEIIP